MKLEALHEFVILVKCQGFSRAAKELFLSQSGLSTHISGLEREIGFQLVDRTEKGFTLTPAGTLFLDYAQTILGTYEEAIKKGCEISRGCPPLRLASVSLRSKYYSVLSKIDIPFLFVDLGFDMTIFNALERRTIDAGICPDYSSTSAIGEVMKRENIMFERIGFEKGAICMMKSNPLAQRENLSRSDLAGCMVNISSGAHFDSWKQTVIDMLGGEIGLKFRLTAVESMANMAFADLGDAVHICGYESIDTYFSQRDDIVIAECLDGKEICYPIGVAYRVDSASDQIHTLIEALKESFGTRSFRKGNESENLT